MRIYVDMDDVMCQFSAARREALRNEPHIEYPQSVPGFFLGLKPISGAVETVNRLRADFDVYVLTAPSTRNPHCYTEKRLWIENQFDYPFTKRLIISPNKALLKGNFLIDDHTEGTGQEDFDGTVIHFGSDAFPDWSAVHGFFRGSVPKPSGTRDVIR